MPSVSTRMSGRRARRVEIRWPARVIAAARSVPCSRLPASRVAATRSRAARSWTPGQAAPSGSSGLACRAKLIASKVRLAGRPSNRLETAANASRCIRGSVLRERSRTTTTWSGFVAAVGCMRRYRRNRPPLRGSPSSSGMTSRRASSGRLLVFATCPTGQEMTAGSSGWVMRKGAPALALASTQKRGAALPAACTRMRRSGDRPVRSGPRPGRSSCQRSPRRRIGAFRWSSTWVVALGSSEKTTSSAAGGSPAVVGASGRT
jgi:hypothetical protein